MNGTCFLSCDFSFESLDVCVLFGISIGVRELIRNSVAGRQIMAI